MIRTAIAIAALAACGQSPGPPAKSPPIENRAGPSGAPVVAPPSPALLASIADGGRDIESLVDGRIGVIHAGYHTDPSEQDPRADDTGLVKFAERLCGDRIPPLLYVVERQVGDRQDDSFWVCTEWACRREGVGEYSLGQKLRFAPRDGQLVLTAVIEIEGGPVTEEFTREARAWIDAQLETLEGARC